MKTESRLRKWLLNGLAVLIILPIAVPVALVFAPLLLLDWARRRLGIP